MSFLLALAVKCDLSVATSRGKELDARDIIRICNDTMHEDAMEFCNLLASVRAPAHQEFKIAERVSAYDACNVDKVARIDEREEERRKWKAYDRNVSKFPAEVSKESSSKDDNPS